MVNNTTPEHSWLTDQVLRFLQRRCKHPPHMVAVDITSGAMPGTDLSYCNRCGAVRMWNEWRTPDPNLWRGR